MSWTSPRTFTSGDVLPASQLNIFLRNNMLMQMPSLATQAGQMFIVTGENKLAARKPVSGVETGSQTFSQTDYSGGVNGPSATAITGKSALVLWACRLNHNVSNDAQMFSSVMVSGDTELELGDGEAQIVDGQPVSQYMRSMQAFFFNSLTPGTNTFTQTYRCASGNATCALREIIVWPF